MVAAWAQPLFVPFIVPSHLLDEALGIKRRKPLHYNRETMRALMSSD